MTRDGFADAIAKGHGRALTHFRALGLEGVEDLFLNACLRDLAYDPQCEGDRVPWLGEFLVGAPGWIAEPVLARLLQAPLEELWWLWKSFSSSRGGFLWMAGPRDGVPKLVPPLVAGDEPGQRSLVRPLGPRPAAPSLRIPLRTGA